MRGDSRTLEFITCIPATPTTSGLVYVKYEVGEAAADDGKELLLHEKGIVRLTTDKEPEKWEKDEAYPLIPSAEEVEFTYPGASQRRKFVVGVAGCMGP